MSFSVVAPVLWNGLSQWLRRVPSTYAFRKTWRAFISQGIQWKICLQIYFFLQTLDNCMVTCCFISPWSKKTKVEYKYFKCVKQRDNKLNQPNVLSCNRNRKTRSAFLSSQADNEGETVVAEDYL